MKKEIYWVKFEGDNKIIWGDRLESDPKAFSITHKDLQEHIKSVTSLHGIPYNFLVYIADTPEGLWYRSLEEI